MALVFGLTAGAYAKGKFVHSADVLPVAAKDVLKKNFKSEVSVVKVSEQFNRVMEYEVILNNGTEVTFDSKGNWKEIEVNRNSKIPASIIPDDISKYVKANHNGANIVGLEKKRDTYDVELSNGVEMKFDLKGHFLRYDD